MDLSEEETAPLVKSERTASHKSSCECAVLVRLYYNPTSKTESTLSIPAGHITAENICVLAAKTSGVLPVFTSLFALASEDLSYWYSPTHVFKSEESVTVYYRVRFFFSGWFGQGSKAAYRYSLTPGRICAVLDYSVIDYLFAQSRSDFISGRGGLSPPRSAMQECLGMAVLDLWQRAKEMNCSPKDVCRTISYKSCLPEVHREDIEQMSRLSRYRIRQMLKRFLRKLGCCPAGDRSLKLKYLMELSAMEPNYGTERFSVRRSGWHQHGDTQSMAVRVSGEGGIQTSSIDSQEWQTFCDFPHITDINMKRVSQGQQLAEGRVVTLTRQDDRCLEVEFKTQEEALSFVSLIDGYFRLTTDSTHYFCSEVAPPSLLQDMDNLCHGPVMSEFAVHKLKKVGGAQNGACLLRHSPKEFDKYFLMVCLQTPLGVDYRDCLIEKSEKFHLAGVHTSFSSLRELVQYYQHNILLLSDTPVTLGRCCPPRAKELSNLIIIRNSSITGVPSSSPQQRARPSHIQFHMIRHEDLVWGESLGQGSFTHIYRGSKTDKRDGEIHTTDVLLKVLDAEHKNSWESFFEAASLMSQISHKHLLLVYGVSVHKSKNIMVQEYVKHGALDLYLKRSAVSLSWKLDVVKQLACTLNFLEEKNIVHGNICAKNLLLVREGEPNSDSSPFIKLSDPGIGVALLGKEVVLDRIPWVAPEVLETLELGQQCDKWSFGTTLWEIFNRGEVPLHRLAPLQKQQFYEQRSQLPCLEWTELAELISQCMQYQPELRPSARAIIRHLNSLITSDYEILHASGTLPDRGSFWAGLSMPIQQHHDVFEERHLRFISPLGKGNFGSVELCRYDPLGDNTGELVAVKQLQPNKQANMADFQKEIQTISSLHCDYIVKYRGICYSAGRLSMRLVMEYLPYGTLIGYMEKNKHNISNRRLLLFASQICKGMEYLQSLRYVHRDLAARNILVASDTLVKIADFGLTKFIPFEKEYYKVTQCGESPIFWYAPESVSDYIFSHKSDVWSFGIVLHELFSFCELSRNPKRLFLQQLGGDMRGTLIAAQLVNVLKNNWRLPSPPLCPPKVYSMMLQCWALNSEDRPTFSRLQDLIESSLLDEREGSKG